MEKKSTQKKRELPMRKSATLTERFTLAITEGLFDSLEELHDLEVDKAQWVRDLIEAELPNALHDARAKQAARSQRSA